MSRLSAEDRYNTDPVFCQLVDVIYHYIDVSSNNGLIYTPTELREAAMLAAMRWEARHIRPTLVLQDPAYHDAKQCPSGFIGCQRCR